MKKAGELRRDPHGESYQIGLDPTNSGEDSRGFQRRMMIKFAVQKDHACCSMEKGFVGRKIRKNKVNQWAMALFQARMDGGLIGQ